jgi:hypothetical protein
LSRPKKTTADPSAARAIPDLWWEKEIPRLQAKIDDIKMQLAQKGPYGPVRRRLVKQLEEALGELNNANLRAAGAHARRTEQSWTTGKIGFVPAMVSQDEAERRKAQRSDPDVAKRRALVKVNPSENAKEMCEIFDREGVPLPRKWLGAGFKKWSEVYKADKYRPKIDSLISKDRHKN